MIKLVDVNITYGDRPVLGGVSWTLAPTDRVALVGENGSGKSTLLKILAGVQEYDRGAREISKNLQVGYLPQEGVTHAGRTLEKEARLALEPILDLERESRSIQARLDDPSLGDDQRLDLIQRMSDLMDEFGLRGGYEVDAEVSRVLAGLGFAEEEKDRPVETFSGGWQMRIALAKILLSKPDVLLLDEPTNHLDLEARNWLEEFLRQRDHSYLIVSHDRFFIDQTVDKIVEVDQGRLIDYRGNYSHFQEEKEKRIQLAQAAYDKQQLEIKRLNTFIAKNKCDKKRAGQVHARMKMLERIDPLDPPRRTSTVRFRFPPSPRGPEEVLRAEGLAKGYGDKEVLKGVDLALFRGEKAAVVGVNGAGKSTLLDSLAGAKKIDSGEIKIGEGVQMAYFGQGAGEDLPGGDTVLEAIERGAPVDVFPRLRNLLGAFLFSGEDVDKKVSVLSGGEKSRLALARLLLKPTNLILLDEPTNHLDLRAKEVLMDAFRNYEGTLLFVAHDRYFLEDLPDRIIEVNDGRLRSYPGDYTDYLLAKEREEAAMIEAQKVGKKGGKKKAAPPPPAPSREKKDKETDKRERMKRRDEEKKRLREERKLQKRMDDLEREITETETAIEEIEARMASPKVASDYVELLDLEKEKKRLTKKVETLIKEWEGLGR